DAEKGTACSEPSGIAHAVDRHRRTAEKVFGYANLTGSQERSRSLRQMRTKYLHEVTPGDLELSGQLGHPGRRLARKTLVQVALNRSPGKGPNARRVRDRHLR